MARDRNPALTMPIFLPINADLRRVGDEGRQGTFDVMKEFFGLMRGGISVARLVLVLRWPTVPQ